VAEEIWTGYLNLKDFDKLDSKSHSLAILEKDDNIRIQKAEEI